jgi:hypothetical protein
MMGLASPLALSGDGNTALVGGPIDNLGIGATWVFTRRGSLWTQQGNKLVGVDAVGAALQGWSVSLSADGNTGIVGGPSDNPDSSCNCGLGAAWVFTRNNGVWTQQGNKLIGTNAVGPAQQGWAVSLSSDGSTAFVGGFFDNSESGAAWVFVLSGGIWTQQGSKLVGSGAVGSALQCWSVSLSSDGNTAIVGGRGENGDTGAAWVFTRNNSPNQFRVHRPGATPTFPHAFTPMLYENGRCRT